MIQYKVKNGAVVPRRKKDRLRLKWRGRDRFFLARASGQEERRELNRAWRLYELDERYSDDL